VNEGMALTATTDAPAVHVSNLTLDGQDAKWLGADVVVNGTLSNGAAGIAAVGDEASYTSVTVASTATYEWQLSEGAGYDDSHFIDTWGDVTLEDGWTLHIVDNGGSHDGSPIRPIRLFLIDSFAFTGNLANVNFVADSGWSTASMALEVQELEYDGDFFDFVVLTGLVALHADTEPDRDVDIADYNNLLLQFGGLRDDEEDPDADFNGDGIVDIEDFEMLRAEYGMGVTSPEGDFGATTTPEPASAALLLLGALGVLRRRRRGEK